MADLPTLPLFVDDYEAATAHLTLEEDGAYSRLLRLCWRTPGCSIPDNDDWIARRMRVDHDEMERVIKPILREFFSLGRGRWFQKRLRAEFGYVTAKVQARKEAGKRGGDAKAAKSKGIKPSKATFPPEQTPSKTVALNPTHFLPSEASSEGDAKASPCPIGESQPSEPKPPSFDEFWSSWPLSKVGKDAARKAFGRLSPRQRIGATSQAAAWCGAWRAANPRLNDIHPSTYLNNKRWEDESQPSLTVIHGGPNDQSSRPSRSTAQSDALRQQLAFAGTARRPSRPDCF